MPDENTIEDASELSIQSQPPDYYAAALTDYRVGDYGRSLPSIYHPYRQAVLNRLATHPQASMWMSSVAALVKEVTSTPWELKGKRRVGFYQNVLLDAQYGEGWESFLQRLLWDFFNCDDGAFMHLIGAGEPSTPLARERIVGIAALSPLFCWPTGNAEFPIWYQDSETNKFHKIHRTRVKRFIDQPFSDPLLRGRGLCALSRAMTYVQQGIATNTYVGQMMDNNPPPGIAIWNKVSERSKVNKMWTDYATSLNPLDGAARSYKPNAEYINTGNDSVTTLDYIKFSVAPDGFNAAEAEKIQAAGIARALGIDVQDVLALSGGQFGTGAQSVVLSKKAEGKMIAFLYSMLERGVNIYIVPDPIRMTFKTRDTQKSMSEAQVTDTHVRVAASMAALPGMPADAHLRYLTNNDEAMADILLDENGELMLLYSDDTEEEINAPIPAENQSVTDVQSDTAPDDPTMTSEAKAFEDVADRFRRRFAPVMIEVNEGNIDGSRRADSIVRSIMRSEGMKAVIDGLKDGGVEVADLKGANAKLYTDWYAETSKYITNLISRLWGYGNGRVERSPEAVAATVDMWIAKSLRDAYLKGLASANADGMYEWIRGATEQGCRDCIGLNGQRHRLSEYVKAGAVPGSSRLGCKGYRCLCKFRKVKGAARGTIVVLGRKHEHLQPNFAAA